MWLPYKNARFLLQMLAVHTGVLGFKYIHTLFKRIKIVRAKYI